jgi:hypothetical protein
MSDCRNATVPASSITVNLSRSVRAHTDQATLEEYARLDREGVELPRIDVFRKPGSSPVEYVLADGSHRLEAWLRNKKTEVPVTIHDGPIAEAVLFAAQANAKHGLPRSPADKRRAVRLLLEQASWSVKSDRQIAEACLVSHHLVADVRAEANNGQAGRRSPGAGQAAATKRVNKRGKEFTVAKKKGTILFDFAGFTKQIGAIAKGIEDIAELYPEEKKCGDYRLVRQAAETLFERYNAWQKKIRASS